MISAADGTFMGISEYIKNKAPDYNNYSGDAREMIRLMDIMQQYWQGKQPKNTIWYITVIQPAFSDDSWCDVKAVYETKWMALMAVNEMNFKPVGYCDAPVYCLEEFCYGDAKVNVSVGGDIWLVSEIAHKDRERKIVGVADKEIGAKLLLKKNQDKWKFYYEGDKPEYLMEKFIVKGINGDG